MWNILVTPLKYQPQLSSPSEEAHLEKTIRLNMRSIICFIGVFLCLRTTASGKRTIHTFEGQHTVNVLTFQLIASNLYIYQHANLINDNVFKLKV